MANNACVRFVEEGFEAMPPLVLGATSFLGLSGAVITYRANHSDTPRTNSLETSQGSIAGTGSHESTASQIEGGAMVFGAPLVGVLAVSAVAALCLRAKNRLTTRNTPDTE